jgi:glycosidase
MHQPLVLKPGLLCLFSLLGLTITACTKHPDKPQAQAMINECNPKPTCERLLLHVPSPDWRDQIIYFLMIDRFGDGNPDNNDQGADVFDPSRESYYSGGDLAGITEKLDYIQNLGATAVWPTPPVASQWWDPLVNYSGYHGYWARDFKSIDEHYGTLEDYQALSHNLHSRNMYLVQDIVVNHVGNYFAYNGAYNPDNVSHNFMLNEQSLPTTAPTQPPFHMNNVNDPAHREADIYHWTPLIMDYKDPLQEKVYQTAGLDDLNTANPAVRAALKDSFGYWIRNVGVDAFRIDTAKYVEADFYEDFIHAPDGINAVAISTGRENFFSFGEVFSMSEPLSDEGEFKILNYVSNSKQRRIDTAIGFPLYKDLNRVFAAGKPSRYLEYRLNAQMRLYPDPYVVPNFVDNHDVERFLAGGNLDGFKQAFATIMTIPGIPVIYQGDEQAFVEHRRAMFAGGYQSDEDMFDENSEMYRFIQKLSRIRLSNPVFTRGELKTLLSNPNAPGALAYKRTHEGESAYIIFNTSDRPTLLNGLPTEFTQNDQVETLLQEQMDKPLKFNASGKLTTVLPARAIAIFKGERTTAKRNLAPSEHTIEWDELPNSYVDQSTAVLSGQASQPNAKLLLIPNGDVARAKPLTTDADGRWQTTVSMANLGSTEEFFEIYWPEKAVASARYTYRASSTKPELEVTQKDDAGDDKGPAGSYIKAAYAQDTCEMDIESATVRSGGHIAQLELTLCEVMWPNDLGHQ